jgi:hypothetical protein
VQDIIHGPDNAVEFARPQSSPFEIRIDRKISEARISIELGLKEKDSKGSDGNHRYYGSSDCP